MVDALAGKKNTGKQTKNRSLPNKEYCELIVVNDGFATFVTGQHMLVGKGCPSYLRSRHRLSSSLFEPICPFVQRTVENECDCVSWSESLQFTMARIGSMVDSDQNKALDCVKPRALGENQHSPLWLKLPMVLYTSTESVKMKFSFAWVEWLQIEFIQEAYCDSVLCKWWRLYFNLGMWAVRAVWV